MCHRQKGEPQAVPGDASGDKSLPAGSGGSIEPKQLFCEPKEAQGPYYSCLVPSRPAADERHWKMKEDNEAQGESNSKACKRTRAEDALDEDVSLELPSRQTFCPALGADYEGLDARCKPRSEKDT